MSDVFDFSDIDPSSVDLGSALTLPDSNGLSFASTIAPPQNLALPSVTGVTGVLGDLAKLVSGVYQGEAALTAAQNANAIAKAKAANQLETVKTTPNIWLVLGLGAAAVFALEVVGRQK